MTRPERALLAAATGVALTGLVLGVWGTDFWPPDEPRVAEIAREMMTHRDWLIPKFNGVPFLEEPPLFYWLQAAAYRVAGGSSTVAARLPAAAAAVIGALATGALAVRLGANPSLAVLVLATAPEYWWMARSATPDTAAAAATAIALGCFFLAWRAGRRRALVVTALALGFAFWCKSLLPVGLAVLTIAVFLVAAGWGRLHVADLALAATGAALLGTAWLSLLTRGVGTEATRFFVVTNHFGRLAGVAAEGHVRSAPYYLWNLLLDLFPWSLALPVAVAAAWRERRTPERFFPLVWAVAMLGVLTVSASKRAHYLLPAYPAFALLVAQWWPDGWRGDVDRAARRLLVLVVVLIGPALALVLSSLHPDRFPTTAGRAARAPRLALATLLHDASPSVAAWAIAAVVLVLGVELLRLDGARRKLATAATLGLSLTAIQTVLTLGALPRLNALCSARPLAERLRGFANRGVPVVTFGRNVDADAALAALFFYAGGELPMTHDPASLAAALGARAGCAVMRRQDYPLLAKAFPAFPVPQEELAGFRLVVLETAPGVCTGRVR